MMTTKGYIARDDVVMVPRSYLRPEFTNFASKVQEAPNPYDVTTTAKKLEKISKQSKGNKYKRDYEFHDTLNNFLDRREKTDAVPPPTRLKMKPTKESKHYEDVTRKNNFQDAYSGTLAALRKVKAETLASDSLKSPHVTPSMSKSTLKALEKVKLRRILREAEEEEKSGNYKSPPFTPKKTRTGIKYGQGGNGYKYVTLFDNSPREYIL